MFQSDDLDKLWVTAYEELSSKSQVRFTTTLTALSQAVACHKCNCFVASLVMCRGAVESMLYVLQQWRKGDTWIYPLGRRSFRSLTKWAIGNGVLTKAQAAKAQEIWDRGSWGAHLEQRLSEERFKGVPQEPYRVNVDSNDSYQTIKTTVEVLTAAANSAYVERRSRV